MKPPAMAAESILEDREVELIKAAAQAWHGHSGNPREAMESEPIHREAGNGNESSARPSRFRQEAARLASNDARARWDFAQSLWDSYEIVTISKRLEYSSIAIPSNNNMSAGKKNKESRRSLRKLFQASPTKL